MRACPTCRASVVTALEFCPLDGAPLYEAAQDPLIGHFVGRYRVDALLGRGAMGSVYRARPPSLDRDFAVKVLHADMACDAKLVERFCREAEALSRIRHSNIVSVVDFVTTEAGLCALVMEYLPGMDLAEVIAGEGALPVERLRTIARGVAMGLDEAHRMRLIHRDVKPSNVRLLREGGAEIPKLVDFGIVRLDDPGPQAQQLTAQDHLVGTPRYMAPEMVMGEDITPAVDMYALGVMMFEMATGAPPFSGQTTADVLVKQATELPPALPPLDGLEHLIEAMMAKDPADRPQSAAEVVRWIDAPPRPARSRRRWAWAAAALVAAVTVGVAGFAMRGPIPAPVRPPVAEAPAVVEEAAVEAPPEPAPPPPAKRVPRASVSEDEVEGLEKELADVLRQRGLTRTDLRYIASTKRHYSSWRRARARRQHGRAATSLKALLPRVKKVRLSPKILERRLDRLLKAIRGSRREIPSVLSEEIERGYFELRVRAREARTEARFRQVSRRISLLEAKIRKYVYGD